MCLTSSVKVVKKNESKFSSQVTNSSCYTYLSTREIGKTKKEKKENEIRIVF